MTRAILICVALLPASVVTAAAQGAHRHHAAHEHHATPAAGAAVDAFVASARDATAPYHDRDRAIADGFRLLGPDFPAMGEHWVHPGRMVDGTLDVSRPQALSYALIDGRPTLIGVIYARPLRPGEAAPDFPVPGYPWHDHVGAIDEESVLLHHVPTEGMGGSGVRLAMLHAWVWTPNPEGTFAADNWALPFARLGLPVPGRIPPPAARALSLLSGGDVYHAMLFRALARPDAAGDQRAREHINVASEHLRRWHAGRGNATAPLAAAELDWLAALWTELWTEVARGAEPVAAERLRLLLDP
jgi:hypothetical protein